ncbi:MAG: CAP domain-containing protein [Firmicutes bacterium]|nr:CAP domain-containing protein [Bacillota bacterium]
MKKAGLIIAEIVVVLLFISPLALTKPINAIPTDSQIYLAEKQIHLAAYNIAGNNYFKLRDLAYALSGTAKSVAVDWDVADSAIYLTNGLPYLPLGEEMAGRENNDCLEALPANFKIYLNMQEIAVSSFIIGGNSYFRLRDLGTALDFGVSWDNELRCIRLEPDQPYIMDIEELSPPLPNTEAYAREVVYLINEERVKKGLTPLDIDTAISAAAYVRAEELKKEWGHMRPNGSFYYSVFDEFHVSYYSCCENIAAGQNSPQSVVKSWLDSPGHRESILGKYNKIGVGVFEVDGYYYWEQLLVLEHK